jgi:TolB-like protein/tetratricopeptide (TPR) repeat protein
VSKSNTLFHELRRRRVFRMTGIYVVAAWVSVQVASETFPALGIPDSAIGYVWVAALVFFPLAVFFSWKYDVTADGIRRTPVADDDATRDYSLKRVDYAVLSALAIIVLITVAGVGQRLVDIRGDVAMAPSTRPIDPNSIAVMPLESVSKDPTDAILAAGVHDALINNLSRISALMVTSRLSTRRVSPELSVPEIGRQLGVAKLLEGSVVVDRNKVRIIVQLIDAASDLNLWAETFERDMTDIISLQNDVARAVADVIDVRLTAREESAMAKAAPVDPTTYRAYLRGMYQFFQETPEADQRGVEMLEEVARQDPDSALAHAGLAYGYASIGHTPPFPAWSHLKAKAASDRALELDPELAEAHMAAGMYEMMYTWNIDAAVRSTQRAIDLNPNLALAHYDLGWGYELLGPEWEEKSLLAGERARDLNPLNIVYVAGLAWQYADACRFDDALRLAREAVRLNPDHPMGWAALGVVQTGLGQFDEAIQAHRKLEGTGFFWFLGISYAAAGLEDKAREFAAQLVGVPGAELALAWIYMNLGDHESALHWIDEAEAAHAAWYPWLLGMFHGSEMIADDPAYQARAAALGFPDPGVMGCTG